MSENMKQNKLFGLATAMGGQTGKGKHDISLKLSVAVLLIIINDL